MRLLADTNIVAQAVRAMRTAGHDVVYTGERTVDPGDRALLAEAAADGRIFLTKDHDIGVLVHRDLQPHCGVLLLDDLSDPAAESRLYWPHCRRIATGSRLALSCEPARPVFANHEAKNQFIGSCGIIFA